MGYVPKKKLYSLKFDDHEGLVVRANTVDTAAFFEISALADVDEPSLDDINMLFTRFSAVLVDWNVETEDEETGERFPVPKTLDGLLSLEFDFVLEIILGWMEAVAGTPAPLEKRSISGDHPLMATIPMEPLSESRAS
jgi:hypothetical protein